MNDAKCVLGLPKTVFDVVSAICADYDRRKNVSFTEPVLKKCNELNHIVDDALLVVDVGLRGIILEDVKANHGYRYSMASTMCSPKYYYKTKRMFVKKIAQDMYLI